MALDPRFMLAPSLEQYFVDKDTGEPLNGAVSFYVDTARTTPKSVFILSGSPPNYSYTDIGNVVSIVNGVLIYNNTNIQLYYFPYDGINSDANVQLYYAVVESSGSIVQFAREGWPNFIVATTTETDQQNYIPNGQFSMHNNLPATSTFDAGEIRAAITDVAYGGWTFERPSGSTATDLVTFPRNGSYSTNPTSSPRYDIRVVCQSPGLGDPFKDLRIKFNDVNKFASETTQYTFYFEGIPNSGNTSVSLVLIKNFGTGGSATTEQTLHTFVLQSGMRPYSFAFSFGNNNGKTIGTADDDFVQLALRFATASQFNIDLTNIALVQNNVDVVLFPIETTSQAKYRAIAGFMPIPAYDGSQLFLPMKLSASGIMFDDAEIGDVVEESQLSIYSGSLHPTTNRMLADGAQYETAAYSPLGIPYSRLQAKYFNTTYNVPIYGTGANYFTAITNAATNNQLIIGNNTEGSVTNAADGSSPTTFTISTIHAGATTIYVDAYLVASSTFYIEGRELGAITTPISAGNSGFTVAVVQVGSTLLPEISSVQTIAASAMTAGHYFEFDSIHSATNQALYVWVKIDGVGTDPARPSRTGIEVDLISTDTADVVAEKIRQSLNGWQVTTVNTVVGSSVTGGSFFTISSPTQAYYVWYKNDGGGTDPAPVGKLGILVNISSADSSAQVATKTQKAINSKYFAAPDFRGYFLRGWDNGASIDPDAGSRWSLVPNIIGNVLGTFQSSQNISHVHTNSAPSGLEPQTGSTTPCFTTLANTNPQGGKESRPKNADVNLVIKY
jgi:hypothetical protein